MTADIEGDFAVFLIGMRINRLWKPHKWMPAMFSMRPMLKALIDDEEIGLLGFTSWWSRTGPLMVQYWRSTEHLERFASAASLPHHPAWKWFNRVVGSSGDVGIWHETFVVKAGQYETVYHNMPIFGLAEAGQHVPIVTKGHAARQRLAYGPVPVPVPTPADPVPVPVPAPADPADGR